MPTPTFPSDQHLLLAIGPAIWGDLYDPSGPPDPFQVSLHSSRDLKDVARRVVLVFRAGPHRREWGDHVYYVEPTEVVVDFLIPEREFYMSKVEDVIRSHFDKAFASFPKQVAPRLFEYDLRIGEVVTVGESRRETWKPCLLFDPPGGVRWPFPRPQVDAPLYAKHYNQWGRCGKCKADLEMGAEVTWGGGHLLWVCRKCHPAPEHLRLFGRRPILPLG
jgi:hypothetical protein